MDSAIATDGKLGQFGVKAQGCSAESLDRGHERTLLQPASHSAHPGLVVTRLDNSREKAASVRG